MATLSSPILVSTRVAVFLFLPFGLPAGLPCREELLAQLFRGDGGAALLDVQDADAVVPDPGLEGLDVERHHLQDLVGPGERGVPQFRGADVGDVLVQQVAAQLQGDVGHEPGADDGAVGLVQVTLHGSHRGRRAAAEVLAAGEFRGALRAQHQGCPADAGAPHRVEPQRHLRDVPAHRNPLGLAARRHRVMRHARAHLDAHGRPEAARDSTKDSGGEKSSGSQSRLVPEVEVVRRAGSSQTPSIPSSETEVASEWTTVAFRNGMRFMVAQAAVVSSISTAVTVRSRDARAIASAPSPQPRSATWPMPASREPLRVPGRDVSRVACSRPAWVKIICRANSPNLASALVRSRDWVSTAETSSGEWPALRSEALSRKASSSRYGPSDASSSHPSGVRSGAIWSCGASAMGIKRSSRRRCPAAVPDRLDGMDDSGTTAAGTAGERRRVGKGPTGAGGASRAGAPQRRRGWPGTPARR